MKKTMSVLLAAAMCSAMLAGCGSTAADTAADASAETTAAAATEAADSSASAEGVNVFKIGGTSPLTGAAAIYGNAVKNGAQIAVDEINKAENKAYKAEDVYFEFAHEIMSNAQENAQIELTEAQVRQTEINTILNVASMFDDETIIKAICDWLDIDYDEIKDKLPKEEESTEEAQKVLDNINTDDGTEV